MSNKEEVAWYEKPDIRNLFMKMGSKALRGYHAPIVSPRTVFVGTNAVIDLCNHLGAFLKPEEKRVLLVVDKDLRKLGEFVAERLKSLKQIDSQIFDHVLPDAPKYTIMEGIKMCQEYDPKILITVGGGSAMDTAKMIHLLYEAPNINLNAAVVPSYFGLRKKIYATVAIPTTSGTGSETTPLSVITDTDRDPPKKTVVYAYELCFDFVVLYPDFVKSMPPYLTMGTGMDALAHSMGTYVLTRSGEYSDMHNLKAIEMILDYLPRAVKRGKDMEAREKMQLAAYIAGVGFGNVSAGVEHSLGHQLGSTFHVHHGVAVALYLCASLAYQSKATNRFFDLAKLFNVKTENKNPDEILRELLINLQTFIKSIGCPLSVKELEKPKISYEDYMAQIDIMTDYAFNDIDSLFSTRPLNTKEMRKMLEIAWENKIDDLMELYYK
ncbi:MAG: iron-containing alcohol dehydrogenase [Promethearchaeota archaeon]